MARLETDRKTIAGGTAVAALVAFPLLYLSSVFVGYAVATLVAAVLVGTAVPTESDPWADAGTAAVLGCLLGAVVAHPAILGPDGLHVTIGDQTYGPVFVGFARFAAAVVFAPVVFGGGALVGRTVARRGSGDGTGGDETDDGVELNDLDQF